MKIKRNKIPEYHRWPMDSTRFILPVIAVRGVSLKNCILYMAVWKYRVSFSIQSNIERDDGASR